MTLLLDAIIEFELLGGEFILEKDHLEVQYPRRQMGALTPVLATLRAHRHEVAILIRGRHSGGVSAPAQCPRLPAGVRLVKYVPKNPPVAVGAINIVTDVDMFIRAYLADLQHRLQHPKTYACATLPEIIAKLAEVGLELTIEPDLAKPVELP